MCVFDSWTAIVRGAVLYGLSLSQPTAQIPSVDNRIARFSYGVSISEYFDASIHSTSKMYFDPYYGVMMCSQRMRWFVKKVPILFPLSIGSVANIFLQ